jgi:GH15 family glucan-1,4-alpha-glucosidase
MPRSPHAHVPIEEYALLGDRQTAALVSRAGSVDWWCVPRFDTGACFAALLGDRTNGRFLLAPTRTTESTRRYVEDTMVLETVHKSPAGKVRVLDFLALDHPRPTLVRIVEGIEGTVEMQLELIVRFDYGDVVPWVYRVDGQWRAIAGPDGLALRTPIHVSGRDHTTSAHFTVGPSDRVPFQLVWFPSNEPKPISEDPFVAVEHTTREWKKWTNRGSFHCEWNELTKRSLLTLEALTYAPTGGIVAAATTSLPEVLGGSRNWDYRFCWVRDATLTLEALLIGGYRSEALRWRDWLLRAGAGEPDRLQTMYGVAGERRLTELELEWLEGYAGSKPVRIGNAAHAQFQLDVFGELTDVLWQAARAGVPPSDNSWALEKLLLQTLEKRWREPDEGIWEVRGRRRHFTHSKIMCWVAFDRAVAMMHHLGYDGPLDRWEAACDEIHDEVCARGYNEEIGAFTQTYDDDTLDASLLLIPLVGFLPATDPRVLSTIDAIQRDLTIDGFVRRYDPHNRDVDGIGESEGVFLPCSFWLVEALALAGRTDEARTLFERVIDLANDVGLFSEEYDPAKKRFVGNFPQAFTHLTLVAAAHTLNPEGFEHKRRRRDPHDGK